MLERYVSNGFKWDLPVTVQDYYIFCKGSSQNCYLPLLLGGRQMQGTKVIVSSCFCVLLFVLIFFFPPAAPDCSSLCPFCRCLRQIASMSPRSSNWHSLITVASAECRSLYKETPELRHYQYLSTPLATTAGRRF